MQSGDDRKPLLAAEQERKAEVEKLVKALARKPVVSGRQARHAGWQWLRVPGSHAQ